MDDGVGPMFVVVCDICVDETFMAPVSAIVGDESRREQA
jgi:hypothetical protein